MKITRNGFGAKRFKAWKTKEGVIINFFGWCILIGF